MRSGERVLERVVTCVESVRLFGFASLLSRSLLALFIALVDARIFPGFPLAVIMKDHEFLTIFLLFN